MTKIPLGLRVVSLYILVGIPIALPILHQQPVQQVASQPLANVQSVAPPSQPQEITGQPIRIELPRIGLTREVIPGSYDTSTKQWTLTNDKTQYATMTNLLSNTAGQTLIYGHNTAAVLEPVKDVVVGDTLTITAQNGHMFTYTYSHDQVVDPTNVSVLTEKPSTPRVVLMTCEGWLSETRRLLYFDFKEVQ